MTPTDRSRLAAERAMVAWLEWCDRWSPGFSSALPMVESSEVERIVALAGQGASAEYRCYVRTFGLADPARLSPFFDDIVFGCDAIAAFYADPPVPVVADAAYLWTASGDCEMYLGTGGVREAAHPVLTFGWNIDPATGRPADGTPVPYEVASSLFAYLYREAYEKLATPRLAHHVSLRENAGDDASRTSTAAATRVDRFVALAGRLGFRRLPYVDPLLPLCERDDALIGLYGSVEAEDAIEIDASDAREARRLAEMLADHLDARPFG